MKVSIINSHIAIQGWMVDELCLRGNKLLIFAIIWGFTGNIKSSKRLDEWSVNYRYIEAWTGLGESMIDIILEELKSDDLIELNYDKTTVRVSKNYEL